MKKHVIGGGILAVVGAIVLLVATFQSSSPKGWIPKHYAKNGRDYSSPQAPIATAAQISRKFKPSDRTYDPTGVYLRYPDAVIAIRPGPRGSTIYVDDPDTGFRRWHSHVAGRWGGPGGRASLFRGGGPGGGGK